MPEESDAIVIENVALIVRKKQVNFTLANCPPGFTLQIKFVSVCVILLITLV